MVEHIAGYEFPELESVLRLGPSGGDLVLVSHAAHVASHLENGFDRQTKADRNFGRVKFLGVKPATFTASFIVLPDEEEDFWDRVVPLLRPRKKGGAAPPMDVINPQINRIGINIVTVVSADIDPPSPRDGRQVVLQLEEWTPAPETVTPAAQGAVNRDPLALEPGATSANQA